jgi:uncharacterized protein YndB with AHSA1/START domain
MTEPAMVHVTYIGTTADKLWEALTSGAFTKLYWYGRRIESDWTVGSPVRFYDGDTDVLTDDGEVLVCDKPRKLSYTFKYVESPDPHGRVTFSIDPAGPEAVRLEIVHDRITEEAVVHYRAGWAPILATLKTYLETGSVLKIES